MITADSAGLNGSTANTMGNEMEQMNLFCDDKQKEMKQTIEEYGPGIDLLYDICYNEHSIKCGPLENCKNCRIGKYMQFLKEHDILEQTPNEEKPQNEYQERWIFEMPKETK